MNRAFFSLYLFVVFSVIGIGWSMDKLWQTINPETTTETSIYAQTLIGVIEENLRLLPAEKMEDRANQLLGDAPLRVSLFDVDEFANSQLGADILEGDIVTVYANSGDQISYKRIRKRSKILCLIYPQLNRENSYIYESLLVVFYVAIALVIFFWVWPLSRDLRRLEQQTRRVGKEGVPNKVNLSKRSTIHQLACSFNKMSERIRELIASHKEMTYAVSHELRTPLARMKFALEMAADSDMRDTKNIHKQLDSMREDVSEMNSLVNELLAFAGFEQSEQKLNQKPGDIKALVKNVLKSASSHHVDFSQKIKDELGGMSVFCEWYLMERALRNLVQNAHRYADKKILVTLGCYDTNYFIAVEDDGPGIPQEDRERVFQSFVRLRMNTSFDKSGFGLGLAIVARIIKWHHGYVRAEESRWGGAKFVISWPQPENIPRTLEI